MVSGSVIELCLIVLICVSMRSSYVATLPSTYILQDEPQQSDQQAESISERFFDEVRQLLEQKISSEAAAAAADLEMTTTTESPLAINAEEHFNAETTISAAAERIAKDNLPAVRPPKPIQVSHHYKNNYLRSRNECELMCLFKHIGFVFVGVRLAKIGFTVRSSCGCFNWCRWPSSNIPSCWSNLDGWVRWINICLGFFAYSLLCRNPNENSTVFILNSSNAHGFALFFSSSLFSFSLSFHFPFNFCWLVRFLPPPSSTYRRTLSELSMRQIIINWRTLGQLMLIRF